VGRVYTGFITGDSVKEFATKSTKGCGIARFYAGGQTMTKTGSSSVKKGENTEGRRTKPEIFRKVFHHGVTEKTFLVIVFGAKQFADGRRSSS
jgi:hypothetical protein